MITSLSPGDIVANRRGHVMCVGRVNEDESVTCFYECYPSVFHKYRLEELRLLSKSKGVDMSHWNSSEFADRIKRSMEWAQGVKGLPPKYREPRPRRSAVGLEDLSGLSDEALTALVAQLEGETQHETSVSEVQEEGTETVSTEPQEGVSDPQSLQDAEVK